VLEWVGHKRHNCPAHRRYFQAGGRALAPLVGPPPRRRKRDTLTEDEVFPADPGAGALVQLLRTEQRGVLIAAIASALDPLDQDVLYHRYIHEHSQDLIAADLGLADVDAVRVILQRDKRRLREEIRRRLEVLGHGASFLHIPDD
jgi:DNA-directed RNA polymerase specialized sigma24 family protein